MTPEAKGRHDPCVVPRAVPIVEAMAALVLMDAVLAQEARDAARSRLPVFKKAEEKEEREERREAVVVDGKLNP